jgi:diaminopimelate epimerase
MFCPSGKGGIRMGESFTFTKMHGLGNSYIYLDGFRDVLPENDFSKWAVQVSNPNTGIGSDGLIAILPSKIAAAKMRIFNKDGSEAKNCGNGLRCVARYVYEKGYVNKTTFSIETASGVVSAKVHLINGEITSVTVNMGRPILTPKEIPLRTTGTESVVNQPFDIEGKRVNLTGVSMGNPHALFFVEKMEDAPIHFLGPVLADGHPIFPEGVNVGFIEMRGNEAIYRVWERGSGITQACGTGACAAAVAMILNQKASMDESIKIHLEGGDLLIRWDSESQEVYMTGPAEKVAEGIFYLNRPKND